MSQVRDAGIVVICVPTPVHADHTPDLGPLTSACEQVAPQWRGADLLAVLAQGASKPLPLGDEFATDKGWVRFWGDAGIDRGHLTLQATSDTTGGAVFLDGSFLWEDYRFEVDLEAHQGHSLSLLGHFHDSANFVACTLQAVRIRQDAP